MKLSTWGEKRNACVATLEIVLSSFDVTKAVLVTIVHDVNLED